MQTSHRASARIVRVVTVSALVGALSLGAAWAGAVLTPARTAGPDVNALPSEAGGPFRGESPSPSPSPLPGLEGGEVYAGAAKVNIAPRPGPDDVWIRGAEAQKTCETAGNPEQMVQHVQDLHTLWPENPGCIYTGGYGLGPANAVSEFDSQYGLWARSFAVGNGEETVILSVIDGTYWQGRYQRMCDACGALDIGEQLAAELGGHGVKASGVFVAATHSHTAPDFIGGWGGVPKWYMEQAAEAIRESARQAVLGMRPAKLETGEILARDHNRDRRKTYYSAQEAGMSWLRAVARDGGTVATLGAYAAHPTTSDYKAGVAHADWPALFNARLEERFGGIGLHFMTGLGQMTARGGRDVGTTLANLVPPVGAGLPVGAPDQAVAVRSANATWNQPITNGVLAGLGGAGLFDRPFGGPAAVEAGRSSTRKCRSAAAVSVDTAVNAARVGNVVFTGAPGETFANLSNTIKEQRTGQVTFPLALVNDGLGYIMQSFESFDEARQGLGFAGSDATEYEDAYSIDRCFGDKVLEESLRLVDALWK